MNLWLVRRARVVLSHLLSEKLAEPLGVLQLGQHQRRNGLVLLVHAYRDRNFITEIIAKLTDGPDHLVHVRAAPRTLLLPPDTQRRILIDALLHDAVRLR